MSVISISDYFIPVASFGGFVASAVGVFVATPIIAKIALVASTIFFFGAFGGFCRCYYAK